MKSGLSRKIRLIIREAWRIHGLEKFASEGIYQEFEEAVIGDLDPIIAEIGSPKPLTSTQERVFSFWNRQEVLVVHRKITSKTKTAISRAVKEYTEDVVIKAIENYSKILEHPDLYFFTYKWTLADFLTRGVEKFQDWDVCSTNFLRDKPNGSRNQPVTGKYENM